MNKKAHSHNSLCSTYKQSGFTMVELLLYMGIFSILLVVLLQLFGAILSTHTESQSTSSLDQDGNFILSRLVSDIHNASGVTSPSLGGSCTWTTGSPTPCTLILNSSTYTAANDTLSLTTSGYTDTLNSINTKITSISFTVLGNDPASASCKTNCKSSVQISLTLQSKIKRGGIVQTESFQTTVATR